ncbi:restriction endonuclease [Halomonas sp. WWR20]
MQLKFDAGLDYQHEAINAVIDLFEGMHQTPNVAYTEFGIANPPLLAPDALLTNLQHVQARHGLARSHVLQEADASYDFPNFSVEMETGTGKTYVYLRTLFELNRRYGLSKFIIVVPSVAIREGVLHSLRLMRTHFKALYENVAFDDFTYQSNDLSRVRRFVISNTLQIMVINLQSFQKDTDKAGNVIHREQDHMSGHKPIEWVQGTCPVVIIDEPQSVDTTAKSQRAIAGLKPLFCLRYSATHAHPYHRLYRLGPCRAYDLGLVKQIEVVDASAAYDFNRAMVRLDWVGYAGRDKKPQANVTLFEATPGGSRAKQVRLTQGTDLARQTNRADYQGFQAVNISAEPGNEHVEFLNGEVVALHRETGGMFEAQMKSQLRETLECHFAKEKALRSRGIKVLSLFFIDQVSHYRSYDEDGNPQQGKLAEWFEELYAEIGAKPAYRDVIPHSAREVHGGYFSIDRRKGRPVALLDTNGRSAKDDDTYRLIMQDKERLLSLDEPLRFIFSHSALREGWDNPNVFQICTLREAGTERERRQTIGRGLRLPVNQAGERIRDAQINRLTIIANETFREFASGLQADIEQAIDPSGNFTFGHVPPLAFTVLLNAAGTDYLTQAQSRRLWTHLHVRSVLDPSGRLQDFSPDTLGSTLALPEEFAGLDDVIVERIRYFQPRQFVKDARQRKRLRYHKRVEFNPHFKALWQRIGQKTRYTVEFSTAELICRAHQEIAAMAAIQPIRIDVRRRTMSLTESGAAGGKVTHHHAYRVDNQQPLPDILAFLQRETALTRATLVQILKASGRLGEFMTNPQGFMAEVAKRINRALHEAIVEGIQYAPLAGERYDMRMFEENDREEYSDRLYQVQHQQDRSPYDYVACGSETERTIAAALDADERVTFFCTLPPWFKVPTPLGDYSPGWAVVVESSAGEGGPLYLVADIHERDKRRESENRKADCAKVHFDALGVTFKVATSLHELTAE